MEKLYLFNVVATLKHTLCLSVCLSLIFASLVRRMNGNSFSHRVRRATIIVGKQKISLYIAGGSKRFCNNFLLGVYQPIIPLVMVIQSNLWQFRTAFLATWWLI